MALGTDTYGSTLLARLGWTNVVTGSDRYPTVEPAELGADVILLPTEPYAFDQRHVDELRPAVARIVDGADLLWWGVRTPAAALERLPDRNHQPSLSAALKRSSASRSNGARRARLT